MNPTQAKEEYRNCWNAWRAMETEEGKIAMEHEMDRLQPMICRGPCPEWDEFTATLPGYREYWAMWTINAADRMLKRIDAVQEELARGYTRDRGQVQPPGAGSPPVAET
jgi:hypothetical protein